MHSVSLKSNRFGAVHTMSIEQQKNEWKKKTFFFRDLFDIRERDKYCCYFIYSHTHDDIVSQCLVGVYVCDFSNFRNEKKWIWNRHWSLTIHRGNPTTIQRWLNWHTHTHIHFLLWIQKLRTFEGESISHRVVYFAIYFTIFVYSLHNGWKHCLPLATCAFFA